MKTFIPLLSIIFLIGCASVESTENEAPVAQENNSAKRPELSLDSKIFFGNRLFSEKTCITCHLVDKKKVGPSVVDIVRVYKENNASIEDFLKGNSKPIVETDSSQVAIMQANIDGFLKKVTDEEINAISTYMLHVDELNSPK
ncbi:MAG: c-type cytochrome [Salibacteraceae bacterium]